MPGDLDHVATDVLVGTPDRVHHVVQHYVEGAQLHRIDDDLVLALEAAHRRHLGHARHTLERVPDIPILDGAEL
jgi:hypothetical protein